MYMTIIMTMNIYITKDNELFLKALSDGSMSGLINRLLDDYRKDKAYDPIPLSPRGPKPVLRLSDAGLVPKLCKHGADPKMCKFAKNGMAFGLGKVCK